MGNPCKRNRDDFLKILEKNYVPRQKENELNLFENIKSDISAIFSEQLRKRSKAEFELSNIEKKFVYLKSLYEETQKLLKKERVDLKNETDLISNYFEYTTTNLDYAFIKYESIIGNLTKANEDMKIEVQHVKEKELKEFKEAYDMLNEQIIILKSLKEDIIEKKNAIKDLEAEYTEVLQKTNEKIVEEKLVEKQYKEMVKEKEEYLEKFQKIKEECTNQMNVKKESVIEIKELENTIKELENSIQQLLEQKKIVVTELKTVEDKKEIILGGLISTNNELNTQCDNLSKEIGFLETETSAMLKKIELMEKNCEELERKLKKIIELCENKKKEDMEINNVLQERTNDFTKSKINLKEMEEKLNILQNEYNLLQGNNQRSEQSISSLQNNLTDIEHKIKECKEKIQSQKQEMIDLKEKQKNNEKEKIELENGIFQLEQTLQQQKSFYFKISKYVNLIIMCNEEYQKIKDQTVDEQKDSYLKSYEEFEKTLENLLQENKEKEAIQLEVSEEHKELQKKISDNEEEINSINIENNKLKELLEDIKETIQCYVKEIEQMKKNSKQKIKETEEMQQIRLEKVQEHLKNEKKAKQQEHDSFLMKAEKEKLDCAFQVFQSELKTHMEKELEELKTKLLKANNELKINEETYNKLKVKV